MEFITESKVLTRTFKDLCKKYTHYKWLLSWADLPKGFKLADVFAENDNRIDRLVVGANLYQTSPAFIERFLRNPKVRYYWQTDGSLHTKLYLFYNSNYDWVALVGSSDFCEASFTRNMEANVMITNKDADLFVYQKISDYIDQVWEKSIRFNKADLDAYTDAYELQQQHLNALKQYKGVVKSDNPRSTAAHLKNAGLDIADWSTFYRQILNTGHDVDLRIAQLQEAEQMFRSVESFTELTPLQRKCLAGFQKKVKGSDINWMRFGSMRGAGEFKNLIMQDNEMARAIDIIPIEGEVSDEQLNAYFQAFSKWKNPLASATRLLAMKRPDLFICIDSANQRSLSERLQIPQNQFTIQNYRPVILNRIYSGNWCQDATEPTTTTEKLVKKYRVAMLDCLCME